MTNSRLIFIFYLLAVVVISTNFSFALAKKKAYNLCGWSEFSNSLSNINQYYRIDAHRLVGAHACRPNAWPWTAELVARHGGHRCGAALIDAHYIVTAAHCFSIVSDPQDYNVLLGGHLTGTGQKHLVKKFAIHPFYNLFQPSSYDVAIARIYPAANFSSTVNKVCLPIMPPPDNKICVVTGWGFDKEDGNRSNVLKEIHVPIIPSFLCNDLLHYQGRVHYPSMLCAGYNSGGIDACQGDSGGPLFCENFGRWELHGIVSWGNGCGRPYNPGVYSKIAPVVPWLRFQMYVLR